MSCKQERVHSYVLAQFAGAVIGALPLLAWGSMGRSVAFGATLPGQGYTIQTVLLGEVSTHRKFGSRRCVVDRVWERSPPGIAVAN